MSEYKRLTNNNLEEYDPEYDFCIGCKYFGEPNGCNQPNGTCSNYERFELPCVAYNVKECKYQIISTKNGRVYASKFYRNRKEAETKLKKLQEKQE